MHKIRLVLLLAVLAFGAGYASAQKSTYYRNPDDAYRRGLELLDKEKYGSARQAFSVYLQSGTDPGWRINAAYYDALCALELFRPDAELLFQQIIDQHPEHPKSYLAYFQLGRFYFRAKDYKRADDNLKKVDIYFLTNEEVIEYRYMNGISAFYNNDFPKALEAFAQIKDLKSKYTYPALYYHGYISFSQGNYSDARKDFEMLKESKNYGTIAPVFIARINYLEGKYQDLLTQSESLTPEQKDSVLILRARAMHALGQYKEAAAEYKTAQGKNLLQQREDYFLFGDSYFRINMGDEAAPALSKAALVEDSLGQVAQYTLALSFLQKDKKNNARLAFYQASKAEFVPDIQEKSAFNYAKLCYELLIPQENLNSLQQFIKNYPNSDYADEARTLLSDAFLSTQNYAEAIPVLEAVKKKDERTQALYQKITYLRAEQLLQDPQTWNEASAYYKKSLTYTPDAKLEGQTYFGMAEIAFRDARYTEAYNLYQKFVNNPEVKKLEYFGAGYYGAGYCKFKEKDFSTALGWFQKYTASESYYFQRPSIYLDAKMREADCLFMGRKYRDAEQAYDYVVNKNGENSDYALYQLALIQGLDGRRERKQQTLSKLISEYPASTYRDDAAFEKAKTFQNAEENEMALREFNSFVNTYPNSIYYPQAVLSIAQIYNANEKDNEAFTWFDKVVKSYPGTEESRIALSSIRDIYVQSGRGDEYLSYIKSSGQGMVTEGFKDSTLYETAASQYKKGNCEAAVKGFNNYLSNVSSPAFALNAHYYKAECEYKLKNYNEALKSYLQVAAMPRNMYSERSVSRIATIYAFSKQPEDALRFYQQLEKLAETKETLLASYLGQMKMAAELNNKDALFLAATHVLNLPSASKEGQTDARLYLGRIYMEQGNLDSAQSHFEILSKEKSPKGAEAKYNLGLIQFKRENYKAAEEEIFEMNDEFSGYEYWVAKAFILLADNTVKQGDLFTAKATLQSVIDATEDPELLAIAKEKLAEITALEGENKQ